jgi:Zn-dependent protease with chaperone function
MKRINPFAFPSKITIIFVLMVLSVVGLSIFLSYVVILALLRFYSFASLPVLLLDYSFLVNTFITLPSLVLFFYYRDPKKKIQSLSLETLNEKYPKISNLITQITGKMGIKPNVVPLLMKDDRYGALVFGTHKQSYIAVTSRLCESLDTMPNFVEAILTHELSHLRNKDLAKHQLAEKILKSYFVISIAQIILLSCVYLFSRGGVGWYTVPTIVNTYLIPLFLLYFLNNSIRNEREYYADARVSSIQKTTENMLSSLRMFLIPTQKKFFKKLSLSFAFDPKKRVEYLNDNTNFLSPSLGLGFMTGIVSALFALAFFSAIIFQVDLPLPIISAISNLLVSYGSTESILGKSALWIVGYTILSISMLPSWFNIILNEDKKRLLMTPSKASLGWFLGFFLASMLFRLPYPLIFLGIQEGEKEILIYSLWVTMSYYISFFFQFCLILLFFSWHTFPFSSKVKLFLIEIMPIVISPISTLLSYSSGLIINPIYVVFLMIFIYWGSSKFLVCPWCGRKTKKTFVFKCPACLHELNTSFLDIY